VQRTVSAYLQFLEVAAARELASRTDRRGKGQVRLVSLEASGEPTALATGRPARFMFQVNPARPGVSCGFTLYDQYGAPVTDLNSASWHPEDVELGSAVDSLTCELEELLLVPGRYRLDVDLTWNGELQDHVEAAAFIDVHPGTLRGRAVQMDGRWGSACMPHRWLTADRASEVSGDGVLARAGLNAVV
jgi:lipopolysaccharide transport system ATP-binding protein